MKRENLIKNWHLVVAFKEGKTIQYRDSDGVWNDIENPGFSREPENYRIKPPPETIFYVEYKTMSGTGRCKVENGRFKEFAEKFGRERFGSDFIRVVEFREVVDE